MSNRIEVLVVGMTSNVGGVETFLLNICRNIDWKKFQFDFLCSSENKIAFESELKKLGSNIYYIVPKRKNYYLHMKQIKKIFKYGKKYDVLWANLNSLANIDYIKYAKKYNYKKVIVHSHNVDNMGDRLQKIAHTLNKCRIDKIATDFWACSKAAGKWFFPNKLGDKIQFIHNAIDIEKFKFNIEKREFYKKKFGLENNIVLGNVGRLHYQKNQIFLINIMEKMLEKDKDYILIIIGDGEDRSFLEKTVKEKQLQNNIIFLGIQEDIGGILSAMDCFVFPSRFEGLSITALEAQANGIPMVVSNEALCEEGTINENIGTLDLNESVEIWCDYIMKYSNFGRKQFDKIEEDFRKKGFLITTEIKKLQKSLMEF